MKKKSEKTWFSLKIFDTLLRLNCKVGVYILLVITNVHIFCKITHTQKTYKPLKYRSSKSVRIEQVLVINRPGVAGDVLQTPP